MNVKISNHQKIITLLGDFFSKMYIFILFIPVYKKLTSEFCLIVNTFFLIFFLSLNLERNKDNFFLL